MPAPDSPAVLVARFLKSSGYTKTLAAFLQETNLDEDVIDRDPTSDLTIEKVLDEKRVFDLSLRYEKTEINNEDVEFTEPYPSVATEITPADVTAANVLFVSVETFAEPFDGPLIIATRADRSLCLFSTKEPYPMQRSFNNLSDSPILCVTVLDGKYLLISTMSGRVSIVDADTGEILSSVTHHTKYATRVLISGSHVATSSYDRSIYVYTLTTTSSGHPTLSEPVGKITPSTPPEALCFVTLPSSGEKALVYSRRDSTFLYYHLLAPTLPLHSQRNLAPDSTSWVHFHAMSLAPHPRDATLLAVATSAVPHMKFLLVRVDADEVLKEVFTGAPQSAYSTAVVAWRADASGVWVNADDGVIRGVEVRSGKVRARLQATLKAEKVRSLWAGLVPAVGEVVVTGAFDKGLKVWRVKEGDGAVDAGAGANGS